ncbi:molybdate ABC transporter substrate-binding protein [Halomonas sp. MCCC 1A11036]|uniref:Molybdate ABC transporter substrate-binding protein n=1 Tax=Billgrantia zhangzhouensis TaxID=2733481 RepID=A0ABS9AG46_9GAMM|nr:molybdate ABC transporter substrate-binding protein [Halomonas zhangzhouensis]MCE8020727.1 molybdate ABC transporter substrate-binding protein [Halomonas zhangzhouensis]
MKKTLVLLSMACSIPVSALADELRVAVAANFLGSMEQLAAEFEERTGANVVISSGASGAFYAQIVNGAPFDVFFSADSQRPERLVEEDLALAESRFTYAIGVPVLWSADEGLVDDQGEVLSSGSYRYLSVADPQNAPYGLAAQQVLTEMGLWSELAEEQRIVQGQTIGQAHSQVASGAAELGFVALAQVIGEDGDINGSYWIPPAEYHDPIVQQAVILNTVQDVELAEAFMEWIKSPRSIEVIEAAGYSVPE